MALSFLTTFLKSQSRAQPSLSPVTSSTLSPSLVALSSAFINILWKSPGLMLWNLSCTKSKPHTLQAAWGGPALCGFPPVTRWLWVPFENQGFKCKVPHPGHGKSDHCPPVSLCTEWTDSKTPCPSWCHRVSFRNLFHPKSPHDRRPERWDYITLQNKGWLLYQMTGLFTLIKNVNTGG